MSQETVKILKMLEDGKISSKEAESLLSAMGGSRHRHAFSDLGIDHSQLKEEMDALARQYPPHKSRQDRGRGHGRGQGGFVRD